MEYDGIDNYGRPKYEYIDKIAKMSEYIDKIAKMSDKELLEETSHALWLSAFAANNPRSDFHWHSQACYDEAEKRNKVDEIYKFARDVAKNTM